MDVAASVGVGGGGGGGGGGSGSTLRWWWWWSPSAATALVTTTAIATASLLVLARATLWPRRQRVLRSPLRTVIPRASSEELRRLVYQPDEFPGARDVDTPYGSVRVYEFGPEDGEKVLFVHGISTSCITLTRIARALADRGCRVMLYVSLHKPPPPPPLMRSCPDTGGPFCPYVFLGRRPLMFRLTMGNSER